MPNDLRLRLEMIQMQLTRLEREMVLLRQALGGSDVPSTAQRSFESLRGIWSGVVFDEQDIRASRLQLPEGL